jgi:nucleotide-binding universal stress UspA family protein
MLIKKILCPTDRSENAKTGMAYALSLGREHRAELVFLNVIQFPWRKMAPCPGDAVAVEEWRSQLAVEHLLKVAASELEIFVQTHFRANIPGVSWTIRTTIGKVSREIVLAAVEEETDCIVMAKRQRGILFRTFARSISDVVTANAPCPVLSLCPPQIEHFSSDRGERLTRQLATVYEF